MSVATRTGRAGHPSGDPSPSAEDVAFTRRMAEAGEAVGIRLVDHLIVGAGGRSSTYRRYLGNFFRPELALPGVPIRLVIRRRQR